MHCFQILIKKKKVCVQRGHFRSYSHSMYTFVKMFQRKKLLSSGDHAYEVAKCLRFDSLDSQRIVKGVRWGDHYWRLLHV